MVCASWSAGTTPHEGHLVQRRLLLSLCLTLLCWCLPQGIDTTPANPVAASAPLTPTFALMREALQQALHLRFTSALEITMRLEQQTQYALEAQLVRGIIAYFQARWQIPPALAARQSGQKVLSTLLKEGQRQLTRSPREPRLQFVLGIASVFHELLQQQSGDSPDPGLLMQGRTWLQQALMSPEMMPDAHLGLGLLYFVGPARPALLPRFVEGVGNDNTTETIYHLRRAAETGYFSGEVAQTFLVRVYEVEKRYQEAITLGQALQAMFPSNRYYALVVGRSQYAQGQYVPCATTLGVLAAGLQAAAAPSLSRDDRFDIYYFLGRALYETVQDGPAFEALRQAINQDPGAVKDASLWAKYYLGILYERRGEAKTARQLYQTLLRGRNVENLHEQVAQRLAQLQ
jgi:tetratricopeptide (TPR) repeat protein